MWAEHQRREREAFDVAEAERRAAGTPSPFGPKALPLPVLDPVTGRSKPDPAKAAHDPDVALFGGWRLKDGEG